MGVMGAFFDGTAKPMVIVIGICAVIAFVLTRLTTRQRCRW